MSEFNKRKTLRSAFFCGKEAAARGIDSHLQDEDFKNLFDDVVNNYDKQDFLNDIIAEWKEGYNDYQYGIVI